MQANYLLMTYLILITLFIKDLLTSPLLCVHFTQYDVDNVLIMDAQWGSLKNLYASVNKTTPRTGRTGRRIINSQGATQRYSADQ